MTLSVENAIDLIGLGGRYRAKVALFASAGMVPQDTLELLDTVEDSIDNCIVGALREAFLDEEGEEADFIANLMNENEEEGGNGKKAT